jgi:hypothetical protein
MISESAFDRFAYIAIAIAFVSFFVMAVNIFRAAANHKDGENVIANLSVLFAQNKLTERGLAARRWCMWGLAGFIVMWLAVAIGSRFVG